MENVEGGFVRWKCLKEECPDPCCGTFAEQAGKAGRMFTLVTKGLSFKDILAVPSVRKKKLIDGYPYVDLSLDGTCPYFKRGRCSIYSRKPLFCTAYPFYFDPSCGLMISSDCPGVGNGITYISDIAVSIDALMELYSLQHKMFRERY